MLLHRWASHDVIRYINGVSIGRVLQSFVSHLSYIDCYSIIAYPYFSIPLLFLIFFLFSSFGFFNYRRVMPVPAKVIDVAGPQTGATDACQGSIETSDITRATSGGRVGTVVLIWIRTTWTVAEFKKLFLRCMDARRFNSMFSGGWDSVMYD